MPCCRALAVAALASCQLCMKLPCLPPEVLNLALVLRPGALVEVVVEVVRHVSGRVSPGGFCHPAVHARTHDEAGTCVHAFDNYHQLLIYLLVIPNTLH